MRYKVTGALIAVVLLLQGCVIAVNTDDFEENDWGEWKSTQKRNLHTIRALEMGRHIGSVRSEMGEPDFMDSFQRDGSTFEVLYYRTRRVHNDGRTTRDETTPLVFVNDALVGWGPSAVEKAAP